MEVSDNGLMTVSARVCYPRLGTTESRLLVSNHHLLAAG